MEEKECGFFENSDTVEIKKQQSLDVSLPLSEANTCKFCSSVPLDYETLKVFNINVCKNCRYNKLKFVTKTIANKDFLLNNEDLKQLKYITRPNPHKGTWHDMQLFLEDDIIKVAETKYNSLEDVDRIKKEREETKKKRKITKFKSKIRELKRKTILLQPAANKHIHSFEGTANSKECTSCGLKVEQEEI